MTYKDLRSFMTELKEKNELIDVTKQIESGTELSAVMWELWDREGEKAPAVRFENIDRENMPIVTGLLSSFRRYAFALDLPKWDNAGYKEVKDCLAQKMQDPEAWPDPEVITPEQAPCKEVILEDDKAILDQLPILKWHDQDGGEYITWTCVVTHDEEWDATNVGTYRSMKVDDQTASVMSQRVQHIGIHQARHREQEEDPTMDAAIVLGPSPTLMMASTIKLPHPKYSEYNYAGTLAGTSIDVVECETSDLLVPANAEIIIEGEFLLDERVNDGGFVEYQGYVGAPQTTPPFKVKSITHRENPMFVTAISGHLYSESSFCYAPWLAIRLQRYADDAVVGFRDLAVLPSARGCIAIIQIDKRNPGWGKQALRSILGSGQGTALLNMAAVVDKDIDIYDLEDVMWAIGTRVDPELDMESYDPTTTAPLNPPGRDRIEDPRTGLPEYVICSKVGIDATLGTKEEPGRKRDSLEVAKIDPDVREKVQENWNEYIPENSLRF